MATTTIDRINELSAEGSRLYREAGDGRRGDAALLRRIKEISLELERLWDLRRQERVGRREGIDLLVDASYEAAYGRDYEESVAPTPVAEPEDEKALAVAA
jgi:hypothetical protein